MQLGPDFSKYEQFVEDKWMEPAIDCPTELYLAVAITGEAGELANVVKKSYREGDCAITPKVLDELGDILYYMTKLANYMGFTLADLQTRNMTKLEARYPRKQNEN